MRVTRMMLPLQKKRQITLDKKKAPTMEPFLFSTY